MNRTLARKLSYGSNATLVTLLVVALVVLLYTVADRHRVRWDLTEAGANALRQDTLHKLALLDAAGQQVDITAFTHQQGKKDAYFKNRELRDFIDELEYNAEVVRAHWIDFDRERLTAEALGVRDYGTVVVQRGQQRVDLRSRDLFRNRGKGQDRELVFLGEAALDQAFSQLLSDSRRVVYALQGHGEPDPESTEPDGLASLGERLEQEHYFLEPLDLVRDRKDPLQAPAVPADASVVLIAKARAPLTEPEHDALLEFVARGGALMVLADVNLPPPHILERLGVRIPEGYVMDQLRVFPYDDRPVPVYRQHAVTEDLINERLVTVMAHVAPVALADPLPAGVQAATLMRTSRQGWTDRGGAMERGAAVYEPQIDHEGPVDMACALELAPGQGVVQAGQPRGRVIVVGDGDLVMNALLAEGPGNATFLVNAFRWLAGDDDRLSIVGRPTSVRKLALTEQDTVMIRWVVLGLLPLIVIVLGGAVYMARRGR
ncbi:MAG: DUF4350 domain-containing protein [Pseudomonadota bacterium]